AELVDAGGIPFDPFLDAFINSAAAMRKELKAQLLEIARKACSQQALPMVGRNEAGDLLLGPIKSECFAETRVGLRRFQFVEALARGKRGYPEHTVQLVQADQVTHDIVACAQRDQSVAAGGAPRPAPGSQGIWHGRPETCASRRRQRGELF